MNLSSWTSWSIQALSRYDLALLLTCVLSWLILGLVALVRPHSVRFVAHLLFPVGALVGLGVALLGGIALTAGHAPQIVVLPLGLPDLPFHVRLDALSGFFLLLLGVAGAGISIFAAGYFRSGEGTAPGLLGLQYHIFLASMAVVMLADDAYLFMVAWETMALSSYFLVTSQHRIPEIRRAGFLYLLMAHVGAICILLSFGVLQGGSWQFTFDAMRERSSHALLGNHRIPACAAGFRRQGRTGSDACVAAGGASGGAFAGLGDDERPDAQDGDLRTAADQLRSAARPLLAMGSAVDSARAVLRACSERSLPPCRPT